MRRLLTTLIILLVVVIAGMTSLVFLINPNDFRDYMINRVEKKNGYKLAINGSLRWHVWPQLSIIAGSTSLTAPGAKVSVVNAENMRLDVKLWPLLSHQLVVKEVLLKNAVIRLIPESEPHDPEAPVAPESAIGQPVNDAADSWKFNIDKLSIADSLLIWQRGSNDQINVRDINLRMEQNANRQASIELSSRINRNQRDLSFTLTADLDLQNYPQNYSANISKLNYNLTGAEFPVEGIQGNASMQANYQQASQKLTFNQLSFTANDNQLSGYASVILSDTPNYTVNLQADKLNLDTLSGWKPELGDKTESRGLTVTSAPVIARDMNDKQSELSLMTTFNANLALKAVNLTYRGLDVQEFELTATNRQGNVNLAKLSGKMGGGDFSLPGSMNATGNMPKFNLRPIVNNIELSELLKAYNLPKALAGSFSMAGHLIGTGLTVDDFSSKWRGKAQMSISEARINGLNIQQLIQQSISRNNSRIQGMDRYEHFTAFKHLQVEGELNKGNLQLRNLSANSAMLEVKGEGVLNIVNKQCDMNFLVRTTGGWKGDERLIQTIQDTEIPLRVYGAWKQLNYQLQVDQVLRKKLQQEAKNALSNWIEKNKNNKDNQDTESLLNKP